MTRAHEAQPNERDAPASEEEGSGSTIGIIVGLTLMVTTFVIAPPGSMPVEGWRVAGVAALMATWWISGALPLPVTSLLPLVIFPLLGIAPLRDAAAPYADPVIFLFLGGFVLGTAMQRWSLHLRIGMRVLGAVGTSPDRLLLGILIATSLVSMWVSNTATAIMMLPVALSVLVLFEKNVEADDVSRRNMGVVLTLAVAYASSIGGLGTPVGSPTNAQLIGYMQREHGVEVGFAQWMVMGVPLVVVMTLGCWLVLKWVYPVRAIRSLDVREIIAGEMTRLGPIAVPERRVAIVFAITAAAWILRPLYGAYVPGIDDTVIAIAAAISFFFIPSGRGGKLLRWHDLRDLPWGVLLLFGGGLSLAAAIGSSGLAAWIAMAVQAFSAWPVFAIVALASIAMLFLTELTSNTAAAAIFLPLGGAIAIGVGFDPLLITVPLTLAASCGFMMPVGTPPNAIAYASGRVTMMQMVRAGIWLNLLGIGLILMVSYSLVGWLFVG